MKSKVSRKQLATTQKERVENVQSFSKNLPVGTTEEVFYKRTGGVSFTSCNCQLKPRWMFVRTYIWTNPTIKRNRWMRYFLQKVFLLKTLETFFEKKKGRASDIMQFYHRRCSAEINLIPFYRKFLFLFDIH